ncbi:unnamed protein product [Zymoseptoria tritici ST99CH_1A5]|uniref:WIBG Mago-binding domain-containing protein n=4 Tax=Zymoseptoria tritici TaxID=1047171 RepID=A0A1X7RW65_ZYMT9|nr:unnamed protein product [Zymoseptoria tritici ST99CH_3D7]SMR53938.1 unnamed protein product [Zymoseptoria tritici ST99CH_1E4]SMR56151.1 unnamed protein product [Zymoseptoria tritici ST99CH_3D1]SMY25334.1 unnamed protein product [Zymoseptoria tritici ST99CH_1A5]
MAPTADTTRSGIRKLSTGESVIPSSTRPDGSVRKEIRVKPGYKPPEDVEVYKNRTAHAWKNRGKGGVVGAEPVEDKSPLQVAAAAAKNAKRREARKKAAATTGNGKAGDEEGTVDGAAGDEVKEPVTVDPEAEKAKEAKKLAKKLRQARELSEKKEKGEGLLPEQFQKVIKIQELIRQLDNLGFDAEGEKKSDDTNAG